MLLLVESNKLIHFRFRQYPCEWLRFKLKFELKKNFRNEDDSIAVSVFVLPREIDNDGDILLNSFKTRLCFAKLIFSSCLPFCVCRKMKKGWCAQFESWMNFNLDDILTLPRSETSLQSCFWNVSTYWIFFAVAVPLLSSVFPTFRSMIFCWSNWKKGARISAFLEICCIASAPQ